MQKGCLEVGVSPLRMGSMPQARFPVALLLQEAFLGSWCGPVSLDPRKPSHSLSAMLGQVLGGMRTPRPGLCPCPFSSWIHSAEQPVNFREPGLLGRIPTPAAALGCLVSLQGQWADLWVVTVGPQDGPELSPHLEAQSGRKAQPGTVRGPAQSQVDGATGRDHTGLELAS